MSDRAENMKTAKRAINTDKHKRVAAVIAQIKDQGRDDDLKATIIARRAGVHRSFVTNHFAAQITHAKTEIQARFITGLSGQTALTAASLRVEMETAKQQARAAEQEIHVLKQRLARTLGDEIAATHPRARPGRQRRRRPPRPHRATARQRDRASRRAPRHPRRTRRRTSAQPHPDPRTERQHPLKRLEGPTRDHVDRSRRGRETRSPRPAAGGWGAALQGDSPRPPSSR